MIGLRNNRNQARDIIEKGDGNIEAPADQLGGSSSESPETAQQNTSDDFWSSFVVANHRSAIFAVYKDGLGPILATAAACLAAETQLNPFQKGALLKDLPFRRASFSKYVSIGHDSRLNDSTVREKLPPKFSVLYLLSGLSSEEFDALQQQGLLTCGLRRSVLEQWIKVRRQPKIGKPKVSKLARAYAAAFKPLVLLPLDREEEFRGRLETLGAEFGMQVVFPADKYMTDWDQALEYIREECRKAVDHFRSQKRQILLSYGKIRTHTTKAA
ncbi:hypothetical protein ACIPUD_39650 [Bradyrhizobium sp. CAR08]